MNLKIHNHMDLVASWALAVIPVPLWFYFLRLWRHSSWEHQSIYFFAACFVLLGVGFTGALRINKGRALSPRLILSSLWLLVLFPIFCFLAFLSAIDGVTVMP